MKTVIDEMSDWGVLRLVVFTGGEPMLMQDEIRRTIEHCSSKGLLTRIVTACHWAKSPDIAEDTLARFKSAGLSEWNFSADDYHQVYVPIERVRYAHDAARKLGIRVLIAHRRKPGGTLTREKLSEELGCDLSEFVVGGTNPINGVIHSGRNIPLEVIPSRPEAELEYDDTGVSWLGGCREVMSQIVVSADKKMRICCGIAGNSIQDLYIGSLESEPLIELIARANNDLITNWLALLGPADIMDFVKSKDPSIEFPGRFVGRCHACHVLWTTPGVQRVLRQHGSERAEWVSTMRGMLDWVSDDWQAGGGRASSGLAQSMIPLAR